LAIVVVTVDSEEVCLFVFVVLVDEIAIISRKRIRSEQEIVAEDDCCWCVFQDVKIKDVLL
jgi:hypothetical protein